MSLLPYCIVLADSYLEIPHSGVEGAKVHLLSSAGLTAPWSALERQAISGNRFKAAALEFHEVVHAVFKERAVIPFRFPTWLTQAELSAHLTDESKRYMDFLQEHAGDVQMEIRVSLSSKPGDPPASSGSEYLQHRASHLRKLRGAADDLRSRFADEVSQWRERELPDGVRLFALVPRSRVPSFRERLSGIGAWPQIRLRTSGPWPATEFLPQPANHGTNL